MTVAFCSVALVLAMDVSASMSDTSWRMQRDGLASAFADPRIQEIVLKQPGGVAVAVVQWASNAVIAHPWVRLASREDIDRLSRAIRQQPRSLEVGTETALGVGLNLGTMLLTAGTQEIIINGEPVSMPCQPQRRVIDISGDGRSNRGIDPAIVRDFAEQNEITINGLPIVTEGDPDVVRHYREAVITGDGFTEVANGFGDFGRAIRRKLATEIASVAGER